MTQSIFRDPKAPLFAAQTKASNQRTSGTVQGSVKHGMVHTASPESTLHHVITAAMPHPLRERADAGIYYMVAYMSIPLEWKKLLTTELCIKFDISFIGPSGTIQRLPPVLLDMNDVLGDRIYIGFDWLWLMRGDMSMSNAPAQPTVEYIKSKLILCASELRALHRGN